MARGAEAKHIDTVAVRQKSLGVGQAVQLFGNGAFERGRWCDVAHLSAPRTQEMVVVFGEVLGQLETGELVVGGDASDDPGSLEVEQVPVCGASGEIGEELGDVVDADGMTGVHEHLNDGLSPGRISLVDSAESILDLGVQVTGCLFS